MALLNRNKDMEVPSPKTASEVTERSNLRWLHIIGFGAAAAVIAVLVVLAGKWIYDSVSNNNPKPVTIAPKSTQNHPTTISPGEESSDSSVPSTNSNSPNSSSSSTQSTPGKTSNGSNQSTNSGSSNLPNNGPGDVLKLFIETSLVAAGLHYLFRRRNATKSN